MEFVLNAATVVLDDTCVLLVRQARGRYSGKWNFPLGKVEPGESIVDAALREALEETGVPVEIRGLVGVWQTCENEETTVTIVFLARTLGEPSAIDQSEIADVHWFQIDQLPHEDLLADEMNAVIRLAMKQVLPIDHVRTYEIVKS